MTEDTIFLLTCLAPIDFPRPDAKMETSSMDRHCSNGGKMDSSPHKSSLANVNGIRLHYLDWGGDGPALLFLAGLNTNAHIFDSLAPRFTDQFHTLALTRRGDGKSDSTDTGYDLDTLTDDIRLFMDTLQINQAILVQHTNEGIELPRFAACFPKRVIKLVFLEPPYDRNDPEFKAMIANWPDITYPEDNGIFYDIKDFLEHQSKVFSGCWGEAMEEEFRHQVTLSPEGKVIYKGSAGKKVVIETRDTYTPETDLAKITTPALCIFPLRDNTYYVQPFMNPSQRAQMVAFFNSFQGPWYQKCIQNFRQAVPHAKIVMLPHSHTYFIITQADLVYDEMMKFLLES